MEQINNNGKKKEEEEGEEEEERRKKLIVDVTFSKSLNEASINGDLHKQSK